MSNPSALHRDTWLPFDGKPLIFDGVDVCINVSELGEGEIRVELIPENEVEGDQWPLDVLRLPANKQQELLDQLRNVGNHLKDHVKSTRMAISFLDQKTLITGIVASIIGAICTAALFTITKVAEVNEISRVKALVEPDLLKITGIAAKVSERDEESKKAIEAIRTARNDIEKQARDVKEITDKYRIDSQAHKIAEMIVNDSSLRRVLASDVTRDAFPKLKATYFKAIFHSENRKAKDAQDYAGDGSWPTFQLNPSGSNYLHDAEFGSRVLATWWVARRGTNGAGWGVIQPVADGRRVRITGSAMADAGAIEAFVYVIYEE